MVRSTGKVHIYHLTVVLFCSYLSIAVAIGLLFCGRQVTTVFSATTVGVPVTVTVNFINVGQGDSIFIETSGKDVLIDGGISDAGSTVVNYLSSLNITCIDLMIATHAHEDHIGGLLAVLESNVTVAAVLVNGQTSASSTYTNFMRLAQNHTVIVAQRGQTYELTSMANLTVFNPTQPLEFAGLNDNSIVVRFQSGNVSFLFAGDAEEQAEQSMLDARLELRSTVLKVGHHGSRTATTELFLDAVSPSYAIISAGKNNSYGHPHSETLQKLLVKGATVYGTYSSGTVVMSTDGASVAIQDNPQPVPEFQSNPILILLIIVTLFTVINHKRKCTS